MEHGHGMEPSVTLDPAEPADWQALRQQGHRMLDDMFDHLAAIRSRPVWQQIPDEVRTPFRQSLPREPAALDETHRLFMENILPYTALNAHPGFMGWVQGGGTPVGMLAEMLAAGLNANTGGRDQIPLEVEKQIVRWMSELFSFPASASGLFVTGSSTANLLGLLVARRRLLGPEVRERGVLAMERKLTAYTSVAAHGCIVKAMDVAGLGSDMLRRIPAAADGAMDIDALRRSIAQDRSAGLSPFLIVGTAGTVDIGAIDDLSTLADIARDEALFFHVDGAYGALGMLAADIAPRLRGIERADSIAFDFHKWLQVPYDAGFILVRDGDLHMATFAAQEKTYLSRAARGLAAGSPWPCDFGPDLSRGFRALKTWFTIRTYGTKKLGAMIAGTCQLAQYLQQRIEALPALELLTPAYLNIVCFRLRCEGEGSGNDDGDDADALNQALLYAIQESGIVAPSSTRIDGRLAIRAAIFNHRTTRADIDALLEVTLRLGDGLRKSMSATKAE